MNIEQIMQELEELKNQPLTTRQHRLKDFLEDNFVSGKFFTIEEVVENFKDNEGQPYYKLNTNPYTHDKCIALANDVKALNWKTGVERYIPIVKNSKGSIKLCENREELEIYINHEKKKYEKAWKYYNHLNGLISLEGTIPFMTQANRVLKDSEIKPIEVFKHD